MVNQPEVVPQPLLRDPGPTPGQPTVTGTCSGVQRAVQGAVPDLEFTDPSDASGKNLKKNLKVELKFISQCPLRYGRVGQPRARGKCTCQCEEA